MITTNIISYISRIDNNVIDFLLKIDLNALFSTLTGVLIGAVITIMFEKWRAYSSNLSNFRYTLLILENMITKYLSLKERIVLDKLKDVTIIKNWIEVAGNLEYLRLPIDSLFKTDLNLHNMNFLTKKHIGILRVIIDIKNEQAQLSFMQTQINNLVLSNPKDSNLDKFYKEISDSINNLEKLLDSLYLKTDFVIKRMIIIGNKMFNRIFRNSELKIGRNFKKYIPNENKKINEGLYELYGEQIDD